MVDAITNQLAGLSIETDQIVDSQLPPNMIISGTISYLLFTAECPTTIMTLDVPPQVLDDYLHNVVTLDMVLYHYYELMKHNKISPMQFIAVYLFCTFRLDMLISNDIERFRECQLNISQWKTYLIERQDPLPNLNYDDILDNMRSIETFNQPMMNVVKMLYNMLAIDHIQDDVDKDAVDKYLKALHILYEFLAITAYPRRIA